MELKVTKPFMHGPAVVRLQEFGDLLGYDYGPNDGIYGPTTERVVKGLQEELGLPITGICDDSTWSAILKHLDKDHAPSDELFVYNLDHVPPKLFNRARVWEDVNGVTIHQTGCRMPRDPYKWINLNAHIGITEEGKIVLCNWFTDFIWHAQGLSSNTIGIEIAGNFYGIEGNESTLWKGGGSAAVLNDKQLVAAGHLFTFIKRELTDRGCKWEVIRAHRQSSKTRHGDPGSAIWKSIAIPWAEQLGIDLITLSNNRFGDGRPIPKEWDSRCSSTYWG